MITSGSPAFGAIGFGVFNDTAIALGITALPDPVTNVQSNFWFMHQMIMTTSNANEAVDFDSAGQRKVVEGYGAVLLVANQGVASFSIAVSFRMLSKYT